MGPEDGNQTQLSLEDDIMQLARLGETAAIKKLYENGKYDAKYQDDEGITPLHWAAINNRFELCRFLLNAGVDVNAKGGESVATPAMWAAQRCHYYIVHILLEYGADPLLTDVQGYNLLHLATIDGNAFLLVLLLHQEIPVDTPDSQGHTALMWAAYKGFPMCVDLFLRWGANINAVDEGDLTPLHWSLVRGSGPCIQKIVEYGADRFALTKDGKTPATVADEMKTTHAWHRALREHGYNQNGNISTLPAGLDGLLRTRPYTSRFFFLLPFGVIPVSLFILSTFSIYISIPVTLFFLFTVQRGTQWIAGKGPSEFRVLQRTPLLAGVFAGTLFWCGLGWLLYILPKTYSSYPFSNIIFSVAYSLTLYFYTLSMVVNPGFVPKLGSRDQQKSVITELLTTWNFDEDHFCVYCMIRKPLRSKHCRRCKRCVSKHDHHCPWIDNCVGSNNFRHFILYIFSMEFGVIIYIRLAVAYFLSLPTPENNQCNIISSSLCSVVNRDTFILLLAIWVSIQLVWVTMLCVVQLVQISRNQTTYENMKGHLFDYRRPTVQGTTSTTESRMISPGNNAGSDFTSGDSNMSLPPLSAAGQGQGAGGGCLSQWKKLLGLDSFMATAQDGLRDRRGRRQQNPFSYGIVGNCQDFWCDPAPYFGDREPGTAMLGGQIVNYNKMYDIELPMQLRNRNSPEAGYVGVETEDAAGFA